jgi:general secretion pathway protein B
MSLILDALRKMEQERKARKQASTGMRQEVLNYRGSERKPERSLLIPIIIAALLTTAAISAYLYLSGSSTSAPPVASPPASLPAQAVQQPAPQPVPIIAPVPAPEQPKPAVAMPPEKSRPKTQQVMKQGEPVQAGGDSSLVVSGIAWQDERGLRRAVINGQLVGEGAEIQGARVVEIRENRVKFNRSGTVFEINYP